MEKNKKITECVGLRFVYSCISIIAFLVVMFLLFNLYVLSVYVNAEVFKEYVSTAEQYSTSPIDKTDKLKSTVFEVNYFIQEYHDIKPESPDYVCFKFVRKELAATTLTEDKYEYYQYKKKPQVWSKLSGSTLDKFECIDKETLDMFGPIFEFYSQTVIGTLYTCIIVFALFFVLMQAFCFTWCGCKFAACCILCGCTSEESENGANGSEQSQEQSEIEPSISREPSQLAPDGELSPRLMSSPSMISPPMLPRNNSKIIIVDSNALRNEQQQMGIQREESQIMESPRSPRLVRQNSYMVSGVTSGMSVSDNPLPRPMLTRQGSILDVNKPGGLMKGLGSRSTIRGFKDDGSFASEE